MSEVTMPQLGETVTEGTITRWTKQVGDTIAVDEVLFEVSTDKVDSEVPSPSAGVLTEILVQEGETADVGTILAKISSADQATGGSADQATGGSADQATGSSADQATGGSADQATGDAPALSNGSAAQAEAEPAPEAADTTNAAVAQEESAEQAPKPAPSPTAAPAPAPPVGAPAASTEGPGLGGRVLSPVVRKLISDNNLDAGQIPGTGAGGRITREDVQGFMDGSPGSAAPPAPAVTAQNAPQATAYPAAGATDPSTPPGAQSSQRSARPAPLPAGQGDQVVPFSNIRRRTAEHMIMSQATSAHTLVTVEVDYDNVDRVRRVKKDQFKKEEGASLTYLPFITRAVVDALREFPYANASVGNNELIVHRDVNVGIAVDLDFEGLLVPVVHGADGLRLRQIARSISDVAYRARNKKLQADDISGGTFTITNAGGYGTFVTYPVINQPQVAILSTDGVKKRPVAIELPDGSDAIVVHPVGILALAWDHRAFDGAYASAFLARVREVLETRDWLAEI